MGDYPDWVRGDRVLVRAGWDGRPTELHALAAAMQTQVQAVDQALGDGRPWDVDGVGPVRDDGLAPLEGLLRGAVERGDDGVAWPTHGYDVIMSRAGGGGFVSLHLHVGASVRGRRRPSNSVSATVVGPSVDGSSRAPSVGLVEAVLKATVRAWDPDSAAAFDRAAARAVEDRGRFAPIVGQRTWVSARLGVVATATSGVSVTSADRGTSLAADDALDSATAVEAICASLEANGIVQLPRTPEGANQRDRDR